MKATFTFILICLLGIGTASAKMQDVTPADFQTAAVSAGIPPTVLYAVALQETGRNVEGSLLPWPWSLNIKGRSYYFESYDDACTRLTDTLETTPAKRVDAGLAQVNIGYHGKRVDEPCDLLDPDVNLRVAATILKEQHRPNQDWLITMGKYHAPSNRAAAARYRASIQKYWNQARRLLKS